MVDYNDIVFVDSVFESQQKGKGRLNMSEQKMPKQFNLTIPVQKSPAAFSPSKENGPIHSKEQDNIADPEDISMICSKVSISKQIKKISENLRFLNEDHKAIKRKAENIGK